jgi:cytochrome c-type biogenesis protein CcmH
MILILFLALTIVAMVTLTLPLLRTKAATAPGKHDITVYHAQLVEVDSDIKRGLMTKTQAENIRTEIHRRMLAADATVHGKHKPFTHRVRKVFAALVIVLLPAVVLYVMLGSPDLPGKPFPARLKDPEYVLATMIKQTQQKLNQSPNREGYRHLAEAFYMMRNYPAATDAYQKAIDLGDTTALTRSEMGESIVLANGGMVTSDALSDFAQALKRDPKDVRARFYTGLAAAQNKDFKKAVSIWKGVQKDSASNASWSDIVNKHIDIYAHEGGFDPASIPPSYPLGR